MDLEPVASLPVNVEMFMPPLMPKAGCDLEERAINNKTERMRVNVDFFILFENGFQGLRVVMGRIESQSHIPEGHSGIEELKRNDIKLAGILEMF